MVRGNQGDDASASSDAAICARVARGVAFGAAAYLAGYAVVLAISFVERGGVGGNALTAAGWLFYGAHFVGVEVPLTGGAVDVLANDDLVSIPPPVFRIVPPVVLALAGFGAARATESTGRAADAIAGASIVAGYLPLAAAGVVLFAFELPQFGVALRPDPVTSVLLAGIAYPVAVGAVAGIVAGARRERRESTEAGGDSRCGNCGERVAQVDRFCRHCGTDLPG